MQPYFFPYIGYFQLMKAVDKFVVYDNIQYTKKGWINRNQFLSNGQSQYFTLPIKKDSDYLDIKERVLAENYLIQNERQLRKFENTYKKAPYYSSVYPIVEKCFSYKNKNLFDFIFNSIHEVKNYLNIDTEILISSDIEYNTNFKNTNRVKNICKLLNANEYINPIGGTLLYDKTDFKNNSIKLSFLKANDLRYPQFNNEFVSFLSILDVLMFNGKDDMEHLLTQFTLI